ncbi:MAG: histidinol-phosphatase [Clostridia bacterium]|nr:histidinol-phosphatase [Clostridia bacterium]
MTLTDFHTHTRFSDGADTAEAMVRQALEKGLRKIGISDHCYTFFDESYCIPKDTVDSYKKEIAALKEKYRGKIDVLCGIEQDMFSGADTAGFDYVLGSAHYLQCGETYLPVDESPAIFESIATEHFGGDYLALTEAYYQTVAQVVARTDCNIIAHFDLVTRFNAGERYFSERAPRYVAAYRQALHVLLDCNKPFEINTKLLARGLKEEPYPRYDICDYIAANGGSFILGSDAHNASEIAFGFEALKSIAEKRGWKIHDEFMD